MQHMPRHPPGTGSRAPFVDETVGSVSGTLKPRGRGTRPGLKISAATVTAAAATVGAVLVVGPGGAAAAGPGYAPAASDSRCTPGRRR